MTQAELPYERAFRQWIEKNGMRWERLALPLGPEESTTAYRFTPPSAPANLVLALHGAGNDALFAWVGIFKQLLLRGSEIFTFDLPGHGRFNRGLFDRDAAVASLDAAMEMCARGRGPRRIHAVGISLGGSVLLGTLPLVQDRLASAALVVAPLEIHLSARTVLAEVGPRTFAVLWRERAHYGLTGLIPSFGPFRRDIYPLRLRETASGGPFSYVKILNRILREMNLEESARRVTVPVLLVYGSRDRIVPAPQGRLLQQKLRKGPLGNVDGTTLSPRWSLSNRATSQWIDDTRDGT